MLGDLGSARQALAVHGGIPVRTRPFPARGVIGPAEKAAVDRLLDTAIATGEPIGYAGPEEEAYCRELAGSLGGGFADGVSSGTAAVYVAVRALGLEPGTEVVVGAVDDPGGMMPVALAGCVPVVADTAPGTYNTGPEQVAACLTGRTGAVLVPHVGGEPADVPGIAAAAAGLPVIEDCAQAHGARLRDRPLGGLGAVATFSTMYGKHHHTGGQGGAVFTRDPQLHRRLRWHADRGKPYGLPAGSGNVVAALNLNMDELHAALGRVQLAGLPAVVAARRRVAAEVAAGLPAATGGVVSLPPLLPGAEPSHWFLRLRYDGSGMTADLAGFRAALAAEGIPLAGQPVLPHTQEWFRQRQGWPCPSGPPAEVRCPNADAALGTHFALRVTERWGAAEVADTLAALAKVVAGLRR